MCKKDEEGGMMGFWMDMDLILGAGVKDGLVIKWFKWVDGMEAKSLYTITVNKAEGLNLVWEKLKAKLEN